MKALSRIGRVAPPDERAAASDDAAGDVASFEAIYRQHAGRVYALCRRLTGSPDEADEMMQEVFLRAWRKLASFESRTGLATWLHTVAVNVVIDDARRRKRRPTVALDPDASLPIPAAPAGLRVDLERALAELPEGARHVIVLHDVYGHSHEEIAELCGITAGTSKSQLHRARTLLREKLA